VGIYSNSHVPKDILIRASPSPALACSLQLSGGGIATHLHRRSTELVREPLQLALLCRLDEALIQAAMNPLIGRHHLAAFHRALEAITFWVEVQAAECYR